MLDLAAAFLNLVPLVIHGGSGKEVLGIAAWRVVTVMADLKSIGHWTAEVLVHNAMNALVLPLPRSLPVSFVINAASPHPATIRLDSDALHQAFDCIVRFGHPRTSSAGGSKGPVLAHRMPLIL